MPPSRKAMTVRERQLSDELHRVRSTYSFQLGLLLTETFARKPWKIPLFPFSFIALNVRFLRRRTERKHTQNSDEANEFDSRCLLLFPTSEEGAASLERCGLLAREWLAQGGNKVILVGSHSAMLDYVPKEALLYPINDPKKMKEHQRGEWNAQCENLLSNILETHRPSRAIFDGPFPYRGLVNIAEYYPKTLWTWIRPEGILNEAVKTRTTMFESIVQFSMEDDENVRLLSRAEKQHHMEVKPIVLNGLGYTLHQGLTNQHKINLLERVPDNLRMINHDEAEFTPLLHNEQLTQLMAAIVPLNIELISSLMTANVPTLCVYNDYSRHETIAMLRKNFAREPLLFCSENDEEQLQICLSTLLDSNNEMRSGANGFENLGLIEQVFKSELPRTS